MNVSKTSRRSPFVVVCFLAVICVRLGEAQVVPDSRGYEVTSVRPARTAETPGGFSWTLDRFSSHNQTVKQLIKTAFEVKLDQQLVGLPVWAESEKYDLEAKMTSEEVATLSKIPLGERLHQYKLLLRDLLQDRFSLVVSTEQRELPTYSLVIAKGGSKIQEVEGLKLVNGELPPPPPPGETRSPGVHLPKATISKGHIVAEAIPMSTLCDWLGSLPEVGDRVVQDQTSLKGTYDLELRWTPDDLETTAIGEGHHDVNTEPGLASALREQLGLELRRTRGKVSVLVVEKIARPTEN